MSLFLWQRLSRRLNHWFSKDKTKESFMEYKHLKVKKLMSLTDVSCSTFSVNQQLFLKIRWPLSIKCYAVPDTREEKIVLPTNSSNFSAPEIGKRPVFTSNQNLRTSWQAESHFQFTQVPSCESSLPLRGAGSFTWKSECWLGEKPGPLMQPLWRLEMRKTAAVGERKREGIPKRNMALSWV